MSGKLIRSVDLQMAITHFCLIVWQDTEFWLIDIFPLTVNLRERT